MSAPHLLQVISPADSADHPLRHSDCWSEDLQEPGGDPLDLNWLHARSMAYDGGELSQGGQARVLDRWQ
jgi:hypothetical protein